MRSTPAGVGRTKGDDIVMSINQAPSLTTADANGIVTMDFGSFTVSAPNAVLQADGKILVDGYAWNLPASAFYSVLVRYNADGSVDTTFGNGGVVTSDTAFTSIFSPEAGVALQADGKIVVGGDGFAVARYNSDGSFDTSFGTGGSVPALEVGTSLSYGVVVEPDGKIVVSGSSDDFGLVRFDSSGNLDPSFGVGGRATASFGSSISGDAHSLVGQPDGKLLVAGRVDIAGDDDFALVRYNTDGSLDATFGTGGKVATDFASEGDEAFSVTLQADGKIVVVGATTTTMGLLVRYNADGSLDTSFGIGGEVTTDAASSVERPETVKIQSDGKIVVAGYSFAGGANADFAIARFNSDGSLDTSFGSGGKVVTDIGDAADHPNSIVIEPDGKILVVGTSGPTGNAPTDLALVRYNSDGSLDTSFGNGAALNRPAFFIEDGSPTVLNAGATVHDADLEAAGSYAGASLTLARHDGANSDDVFGASGNLSALDQGGDIVLSGVTIGTVTQNSGGMLVLAFGAAATEARVDEAMRAITYKDTSDTPESSVQIDWSFSDGNTGAQGDGGALAATGSTTVKITAVNDAPVNTMPGPLSAVANIDFAIAGLSVSDPDSASLDTVLHVNHGTLTVAAVGGASVFGSGTAEVSISGSVEQIAATLGASHNVLYHGAADFSGTDTLSMTTFDGAGPSGASASSSVALNVTGSVSIDDVTITEGDSGTKVATFTVTRGDATAPIDVNFATSDGDATTTDNDYVATSGTLHFDTGVKTQTISVTINGDSKFESDETFSIDLSGATNGAIISDGSGTGTITNDDAEPVGSLAIDDVTISEGDSGNKVATFTVTRSGGTAAFAVNFATSDGSATTADNDYFPTAGTLNFAHGDTTQTISVIIDGDSKVESDEAFSVNLSDATNGATISDGSGTGTITNDDVVPAGSVSINDVTITEGNSGTKIETFTVTRSGGTGAFDVNFATSDNSATVADSDYVAKAGALHFDAGVNSQTISVTVNGDTKVEAHETFFVNLSGATNGATISHSQGTGTIFDDDGAPVHDFSGDGKSDILWRHDNGTVVSWDMNDSHILGTNIFAQEPSDWKIAGTGDFNGDGKADVLWHNDNGLIATWDMNDSQVLKVNVLGQEPNEWQIAGTGDFNGDGKADILWRHDNGLVATWDINDSQILGVNTFPQQPNDWKIAGTGDFNGDGKADILWRNDNGLIATWDMNGSQILSVNVLGQEPTQWKIAGIGDFNGDHKADILWRHDNGTIATWDMNDNQILSVNVLGQEPTEWKIAGTGDFSGDGKADILWRHDNGTVVTWDMNDSQVVSLNIVAQEPNDWHIIA
jgi:uncharacterized delta-60 repeat protein